MNPSRMYSRKSKESSRNILSSDILLVINTICFIEGRVPTSQLDVYQEQKPLNQFQPRGALFGFMDVLFVGKGLIRPIN